MDIPKDDLPSLSLLCGVEVGKPIPAQALSHYWRARRLTSRMGNNGPLPATTLVQVGLCAGLGYEQKVDVVDESFTDKVRLGKVISGDDIEVTWRGEKHTVKFLLIRSDGEIEVQFVDHKVPRAIPVLDCRAIHERVAEAPTQVEVPDGVIVSKRRQRLAEEAARREAEAAFKKRLKDGGKEPRDEIKAEKKAARRAKAEEETLEEAVV